MASLHAAAVGAIEPTGIAEFGDINHASGYDFMAEEIRRIGGRNCSCPRATTSMAEARGA